MGRRTRATLSDIDSYYASLTRESDRACAILARALMEEGLRKLFVASFTQDAPLSEILEGQGPLSTLSARLKVASALGWLPEDLARDINTVRDIGNAFAHGLDHEMSFNDPPIGDRVYAIHHARVMIEAGNRFDRKIAPEVIEAARTTPRARFQLAVGYLWHELTVLEAKAKQAVRPQGLTELVRAAFDIK
jgi:DNA-binding MltR family transcriptional regulator